MSRSRKDETEHSSNKTLLLTREKTDEKDLGSKELNISGKNQNRNRAIILRNLLF